MMYSDEEWPSGGMNKLKVPILTKKCQFCAAFFVDDVSCAGHSEGCMARLSAFLATDGRIKFACMVCRDVFEGTDELSKHEKLHTYPGGFCCTICNEQFLIETDRIRHSEDVHKVFECLRCAKVNAFSDGNSYVEHCAIEHHGEGGYAVCLECGASFAEKTHLRFHSETECGRFRGWACNHCAALFQTERALSEHMESHLPTGIKHEYECEEMPELEFASIDSTPNLQIAPINEPFIDPMEINRSQHSDDYQFPEETCMVKDEVFEFNGGFITESTEKPPESAFESGEDIEKPMSGRRERFSCHFCGSRFSRKTNLTKHLKNHRDHENVKKTDRVSHPEGDTSFSTPATCEICGKSFKHLKFLRIHSKVHTRSETYQCEYCDRVFTLKPQKIAHLFKHTGVKSFQCIECHKRFVTLTRLKSHRKSAKKSCTPGRNRQTACDDSQGRVNEVKLKVKGWERLNELEYACKICRQKYTNKKALKRHIKVHGPDGKLGHKCMRCPKYFATKEERKLHRSVDHSEIESCPHCKKVYRSREGLRNHIRDRHEDKTKEKYICSKCGTAFVAQLSFKNHEKSDCGRNPIYKCEQCGKCLVTEYTYRAHLKIHREDSKTFICSFCGKGWRCKGALDMHVRYHTGEKPYVCTFCDKRFFDRASLKTHESIHTGIKPYMCQCGDRFSCISNLQSHRRARKTTCGMLPLISKAFPRIEPPSS